MWLLAIVVSRVAEHAAAHGAAVPAPPRLDVVALFGFLSAFATLGCLPYLKTSRGARLFFALSLAANGVYAFLSGAWPLGLVAIAVTGMAVHAWWEERRAVGHVPVNVSRPVRIHRREALRVFDSGCAPENN